MCRDTFLVLTRRSFVYAILILTAQIEAVTLTGVVTGKNDGNRPVPGVLVALDHTLYRTFTDSSGAFSFEIPEIGIGQLSHHKIPKTFSVTYNQRLSSVFFPKNGNVAEFAMYRLDGKEIVKKLIAENETKITVPHLSSGLYILRLAFTNGVTCSGTLLSTPSMIVRKTSLNVSNSEKIVSAAVPSGHKIIFRHDKYYPLDIDYTIGMDTLHAVMKADPRGDFFDDSQMHTMRFTISNADSLFMEQNATEENYIAAEFNFNEAQSGTVGIRYKGSDYSLGRCFDDAGNRSDYEDCRNISLKIKFNEFNDTNRFFSMKKLNLHSMSYDHSKMREMFAYKLFRDMGIYTCRTVFVKVYINNVYRGLFTAVENIDGRFTKSRWPEYGDGNMYKERWPLKTISKIFYTADGGLVTNNDVGDTVWPVRMMDMAKAINASTPQDFRANVSPFMDIDYFVNYIVVDRAIHNSDGIMTWYVIDGWQGNHNFYFYEEENKGGKAWLIPWDLNSTLHPEDMVIDDYDAPDWNEAPDSCKPVVIWGGDRMLPPNCIKLINLTASACWDQFTFAGKYYLEHVFTKERMRGHLKKLTALIAPAMESDPWTTKAVWEKNIRYFDVSIDKLHSGFDDHLHGRKTPVDSTSFHKATDPDSGFSMVHCNNFEFNKPFLPIDWIYTEASVNSTISASVDTLTPLWGRGSLKIQLAFNPFDTTKKYAEWSSTELTFRQVSDFTAVDSIRICIQADAARECRVNLESDLYKKLGVTEGRYGWRATVNKRNRQFSFAIEDAEFPDWAENNDPGNIDTVLTVISGIGINIYPQYQNNGKLRFVPDSGLVKIDNIEFIMKKP